MRCLFLASGHGGDYFAIEKARHAGVLDVESISVASTSETSPCLKDAAQKGYWTEHFSLTKEERRNKLGEKLLDVFYRIDFDICFLAGFRYIVPFPVIEKYSRKIVNSHHSILPANPGLFIKEDLVQSDNKLLGATVHYVDAGIDTGEIICQAAFPNYGMENFTTILAKYRFVQDVLAVYSVLHLTGANITDETNHVFDDIIFSPAVPTSTLNIF